MPQTRANKEQVVEELTAKLAAAQSVYVTDFTGLNVELMTLLRSRLRAESIECHVAKNTLAQFAASQAGLPNIESYLQGPTAMIIAHDPVASAKILTTFIRTNQDRPRIKGGVLSGSIIDAAQVQHLASLPSREVLIGKVVGGIAAPLAGLVYTLSGVIGNLVRVLGAITEQQSGGPAPAE